jgi:hypothetical protein
MTTANAWKQRNHKKPMRIADAEWRLALDDGGRLLNLCAAELCGWTAGDAPREGFDPVIPSALEKDRWYPLRPERCRLTPAGAFAFDESEAKANGMRPARTVSKSSSASN